MAVKVRGGRRGSVAVATRSVPDTTNNPTYLMRANPKARLVLFHPETQEGPGSKCWVHHCHRLRSNVTGPALA